MDRKEIFDSQFSKDFDSLLRRMDLSSWFRYYFIIKKVLEFKSESVLEIGIGDKIVKNCLKESVDNYMTMDINQKLNPDILSDLRNFHSEIKEKFDCVICSEVLEHIPFEDIEKNLSNIFSYLKKDGKAVLTLPHRRARLMTITPLSYQKPVIITLPSWFKSSPGLFYRRFFKKEIWIDPEHCWEIGDGKIKIKDVEESFSKAGFKIKEFKKLLHVDLWILEKQT